MTEETKTDKNFSYGDWDADFKSQESSSERRKAKYVKFDKPGVYQVRLVGQFVTFLSHNWALFKRKVITHESWKKEDPAWVAGFYPSRKWAIHVINRATGEVEILEKGKKIFETFASYKQVNGINPASLKDAPDFQIKVSWPKGNKRAASYTITPLAKAAPLTQEEIAKIKAEKYPLEEMYKVTPLEKIKELWNALPEESKIKKDEEEHEAVKPVVNEKKAEVIAEPNNETSSGDNLFDGDETNNDDDVPF